MFKELKLIKIWSLMFFATLFILLSFVIADTIMLNMLIFYIACCLIWADYKMSVIFEYMEEKQVEAYSPAISVLWLIYVVFAPLDMLFNGSNR